MANHISAGKVARILRTDKVTILKTAELMEKKFNKTLVLDKIVSENNFRMKELMGILKLPKNSKAIEVHKAIISKLKKDDRKLFEILGEPNCEKKDTCHKSLSLALEITDKKRGFFIKKDKAKEILLTNPPPNILSALGYKNAKELLEKEDWREVYAALRFVESRDWMNNVFSKAYLKLQSSDFEYRDIEIIVLNEKWLKVAEKFIQKKYHNLSHLKELGIVFIIPISSGVCGETLRMFSLILHYLNEIPFYSKLLEKHKENSSFGETLVSLIRGDVLSEKLPFGFFRIVQRYLAKDDVNDFRLFEPHVNPETMHWSKAEESLSKLDAKYPGLEFAFWEGLNFVGDFLKGDLDDELISFNLIDNEMGLAKQKEMIKYLYHHQESLWNKFFYEFVGGKTMMEKIIIENWEKGYIEV
ncbi:MAG: hypothetical protein PHN19_03920 [Patescibacteria group bacterium]|nr:hypothetical protein [Patescibacteria group bacterium]